MDKYVKSIKEGLEESIDFFGNPRKGEREIWVVREFLSYLMDDFDVNEIHESLQEPIDVTFNNVGFQVKEIQSEGAKRTKEYKDKLHAITEDTRPSDLLEEYRHLHIPLINAVLRLSSELKRHRTQKYYNATSDINVLVYLNLRDTTYNDTEVDFTLIKEELEHWLSVSVLTNNCAIVLSCNDPDQELLYTHVGLLKLNKLTRS